MKIVWDEPKRKANRKARGLDFADLDVEFFLEAHVEQAKEGRLKAIGEFRGTAIAVIFRPLGTEACPSYRCAGQAERNL